eukprot:1825473-Amphidinium_carterae.1
MQLATQGWQQQRVEKLRYFAIVGDMSGICVHLPHGLVHIDTSRCEFDWKVLGRCGGRIGVVKCWYCSWAGCLGSPTSILDALGEVDLVMHQHRATLHSRVQHYLRTEQTPLLSPKFKKY